MVGIPKQMISKTEVGANDVCCNLRGRYSWLKDLKKPKLDQINDVDTS